ncbi:hypothetical protein P7K49_031302 [Saguinus oedipus]|uniref:Ku70/Ku80 N-terminal alpha/beta domain-containing protein n=1 Tax=Saguinus oedipus TaxID=9490 RepID=A0ABQ9TZ06_SAGOE|nr:hypothetical protein P7K49_031302 [Saguinus oedipus]
MSIQCIQSKIISSNRDLSAVVFCGTEEDRNPQGQKRFHELMGHGSDCSPSEVRWVCASLFSDVQFKMSHKRIMLLTNEDNPHSNDSAKPAGPKADISTGEDEDLRIHFEESSKLEDLLWKVRAKETRNTKSSQIYGSRQIILRKRKQKS